jgi:hypothetical protein
LQRRAIAVIVLLAHAPRGLRAGTVLIVIASRASHWNTSSSKFRRECTRADYQDRLARARRERVAGRTLTRREINSPISPKLRTVMRGKDRGSRIGRTGQRSRTRPEMAL